MESLDLTGSWVGILSILVFVAAYVLVIFEESTHMRKSKPVMLAAGGHVLKVRATDNAGKTQPETAGWNPAGYMRNVIESVRVTAV